MNTSTQTIERASRKRGPGFHLPDPGRQLLKHADRVRELRLVLYGLRARTRRPLFG